jgi:hypothetical protein
MEQVITKLAREIAWSVGNAIVDSDSERLKSIDLGQSAIIREIVELEAYSVINSMLEKNNDINKLLANI